MKAMFRLLAAVVLLTAVARAQAPQLQSVAGDYVIKDFHFTSGEALPELKMHYRTVGKPQRDAQGVVRNAVLVMHGTGGTGAQFIGRNFAGELFGPGQPLDSSQYYIIMPDDIGHGGSSKPSLGLRAKFPHYGYVDMVEAEYQLVTQGLGVNHLRLVMGTSMGGMHTWLWGERHPEFMDALMPLASLPTQISGRNRVWRRIVIDAIRNDPEWKNGDYTSEPQSLRTAAQMLWLVGSNPILRQKQAPTLADADVRVVREHDQQDHEEEPDRREPVDLEDAAEGAVEPDERPGDEDRERHDLQVAEESLGVWSPTEHDGGVSLARGGRHYRPPYPFAGIRNADRSAIRFG
jgi:homoserine O-acetyltransferase